MYKYAYIYRYTAYEESFSFSLSHFHIIIITSCFILFVVHCFNVPDNFFDTSVDVINFFLNGGTDVDFHDLNDDVIEDPDEHVENRVDQPVGEDVAGEADAETAAREKH